MRALVIGASGLVGSHIFNLCKSRDWSTIGTHFTYKTNNLIYLDIRSEYLVRSIFRDFSPNLVFLPAFCANVDYCEANEIESHKVNVLGSNTIIKYCQLFQSKLVFYSSDYIFDGSSGTYSEYDKPSPICVYGQQKLLVESLIQKALSDYLIVRTTGVYGWERQNKNFVARLIKSLQQKELILVPTDQFSTPTLVNDLVTVTMMLHDKNVSGVFHIAGTTYLSRYQFALQVAHIFNLNRSLIQPVRTANLGQFSPRPLQGGLYSLKLDSELQSHIKTVIEGLNHLKDNRYV